MKILVYTLTLAAINIALLGCYSVGSFAGHDEKIVPWEPTLTVEAPATPSPAPSPAPAPAVPVQVAPDSAAPAEPAKSRPREIRPTPAESSPFASKAVIPPPDIRLSAPATGSNLPAGASQTRLVSDEALTTGTAVPSEAAIPSEVQTPTVSPDKMMADAAKLDSNSTRRNIYVAVAKRTDLGPNNQVRLVNDSYDNLHSETAIEEVFITLIQNPSFAPAAQNAIMRRIDNFLSEPAKQRITAALIPK